MSQIYIDPKTGARHEFPDDATPAEIDAATQPVAPSAPRSFVGDVVEPFAGSGKQIADAIVPPPGQDPGLLSRIRSGVGGAVQALAAPTTALGNVLGHGSSYLMDQSGDLSDETLDRKIQAARALRERLGSAAGADPEVNALPAYERLRAMPYAERIAQGREATSTGAGQVIAGVSGLPGLVKAAPTIAKVARPVVGGITGGVRGGRETIPGAAREAVEGIFNKPLITGSSLIAHGFGDLSPLLAYSPALYQILKGTGKSLIGIGKGARTGFREGVGKFDAPTSPVTPAKTPITDWLLGAKDRREMDDAWDLLPASHPTKAAARAAGEPAVSQPAPFNPARVGMTQEQFAQLHPSAQAEITRQAGTATVTRPAQTGMVTPSGQASAGVSGGTSQLQDILARARKPTVRFGPGGMSPGGQGAAPMPAGPALPMARQHVPAEQIQNLPPTGPLPPPPPMGMPPASPMADILRKDPTLRSALESAQQWRNQHRRGFATGGTVGAPANDDLLARILQSVAPPQPSAVSRLRQFKSRIPR